MSEKHLAWVGSTLDVVREFPADARRLAGYQLRRVQHGLMPENWKSMPSVGAGVYELRIHTRLEHRLFYVAKFDEAIYVLHAFEKRTRQTAQSDLDLARARLGIVMRERRKRTEES